MLWRTLYWVIPTLVVMTLLAMIFHYQQRDDPHSVGWRADSDEADYDHMMRMGGFVRLNAAQVRELLGMTFYEINGQWVIYYDATGKGKFRSARTRFPDGTYTDQGFREITEDGRYCTKWRKLREGRRRCGWVWRKGVPGGEDLLYGLLRHGWIGSKYTVRRGNVEGL